MPSILSRLQTIVPLPATVHAELAFFRAEVRRDLEWLLNTRRIPEEVSAELELVRQSVYNYGLPDLPHLNLNPIAIKAHQDSLALVIKATICRYEPRITAVAVEAQGKIDDRRELLFAISGRLRLHNHVLPVAYSTKFDVSRSEYTVNDGSGGLHA